ncbi:MAG TPA: prepilin-type N-terminal cleavage/methylation domain-containing protein [bacterium]|nr:prepilin-type N-terminal cleavage/methylation domain-containing protein [bacterium]
MLTLKNKNNKGFTLIEVLIAIFILSIATLTTYSLYNMSLKILWESKAKVTATQLANQKMEMARNLSYNQVGTLGGIPAGIIPPVEIITRNGIEFSVNTFINYIDDPFDGTINSTTTPDTLSADYKQIRVEVSWISKFGAKKLTFLSSITPKGIESETGGGTLKILVFNSAGQPVPQAQVHIINSTVTPAVDLNTQTDSAGLVFLPGAPTAIESYQISTTKNGYSVDQTYVATADMPTTTKPPLSIYEGQVTSISFCIDETSSITNTVKDSNGIYLSSIDINIKGEKIIGYTASSTPIYKYDQDKKTNAVGLIGLTNLEWDSYHFTLLDHEPYNISESSPIQPLNLSPNTSTTISLTLAPKETHSVLVIIKDVDSQPVADATVHLFNTGLGLDSIATTTDAGQAYFAPWQAATTTLEVSKDGYNNYQDVLDISGYYTETITLIRP